MLQEATNTKSEVEGNSNEKDFDINGKMRNFDEFSGKVGHA